MARFRKKPVVITAVQLRWDTWNEMSEHAGVGKLSEGKPEVCYVGPFVGKPDSTNGIIGLKIPTLDGVMFANENDWVIRGVKGELYPCKPDVFEATYEPVGEADGS